LSLEGPSSLENKFWLPLDNAAKIFPAIITEEHSGVFRLSAILDHNVIINKLLKAVKLTEDRFPCYKVTLRKGFFWYYLEHIEHPAVPVIDKGLLCRSFKKKSENPLLFRILVYSKRISVEFSHILTDGAGGFQFFVFLMKSYFVGTEMLPDHVTKIFDKDQLTKEECEDAYNKYFKKNIPVPPRIQKAFHLPYSLNDKPRFRTLVFEIPIEQIKKLAGEKGVSITDYLTAIYLTVIQDIYNELPRYSRLRKHKFIRIQIPVNLRNIYPSKTMRNFSLFVLPGIDTRLGMYSFDELLKIVFHTIRLETDKKLINKIISRNVGSERKLLVRAIPLFIKSLILSMKYYSEGTNQYSGVVTNLGMVNLPPEINKRINSLILVAPPPNRKLKVNCAVLGYKDKLVLSFGNISISNELEKKFIAFLNNMGIHVKIINY